MSPRVGLLQYDGSECLLKKPKKCNYDTCHADRLSEVAAAAKKQWLPHPDTMHLPHRCLGGFCD